ncbi:MAG TPA: NAD(P)/FAD-dependent oxidoreductase [Gemmatimonadaceae bacterium]|nr:NAD(P)/FAD-dependent oxidoreductase [Gemmatimonadaceae bacterium]
MTAERYVDRMTAERYDVAVIGGGPAGLAAALWLARYLHTVVVIDSGDPRNWETRGINGYLGHQGIRSPELRAIGRAECESFGVSFVDGLVDTALNETGDLFAVHLRDGSEINARRILLAIGIKDVWPDIPGLDRCYGDTVHVCPDCDGYETRDRKTVVIGKGRKAVGMALALTTWTRAIVICTDGEKPDMDQELLNQLKVLNIPVLDAPIECVRSHASEIKAIELRGGMELDCERLYFAIGQYPADDLGAQLGCKRDEMGRLVIDDRNHTSVLNVFAAGDIAPGPQLAIGAAASGAVAAMAIHSSLVPETRKLPDTSPAKRPAESTKRSVESAASR